MRWIRRDIRRKRGGRLFRIGGHAEATTCDCFCSDRGRALAGIVLEHPMQGRVAAQPHVLRERGMWKLTWTCVALCALAGAASAQIAAPHFINLQGGDMLSSNVVGLDVYDNQKDDVGKIEDVVFDKSKTVNGYILSVGGFLGVGTRYVAVDPAAVNIAYDANAKKWRASINATKDQLKEAPEFKYHGEWTASKN
jgi:sporulation protein YlmC with PRC-barrel domain